MNTMILDHSKKSISIACKVLSEGGIIAVPTETVFGLIADPDNIDAINYLYELKGRSKYKPVSLLVSNIKQAMDKWDIVKEERFTRFLEVFWPGALTIVNNKKSSISNVLTAGKNTIGIRFPDNELLIRIINTFGSPVAATSANLSGEEDMALWEEVYNKFTGKIDAVFRGKSEHGIASTVIEIRNKKIEVLREGIVESEKLIRYWENIISK